MRSWVITRQSGRVQSINYLGRTKAGTSAVTGTKCLSKSNFPLIVSEKKEVNKNRDRL